MKNEMKQEIGNNIYKLLEDSSLTYERLAGLLDLASPRVIYEWVSGNKLPSLVNICKMKIIFKTNLESIIGNYDAFFVPLVHFHIINYII